MVKLTPELIEQAGQYTNPIRDRELDLRGYKIPVIENLGATLDQFDTFDMSDNEIRKVDGFPLLKRLASLILNNNRIVRIGEHLEEQLPNLETLILTNNSLQELGDIDNVASIKTLKYLSLMRNPITTKRHYRLYCIHKIPSLRLLDFQKIKQREREAASEMFKGKKGQALARDMSKRAKTFVPGGGPSGPAARPGPGAAAARPEPVRPDLQAVTAAIANAKTLEEVARLSQLLQTGQLPGQHGQEVNGRHEEMDED